MCRRVDCAKCGRPTYAGCGKHIEQVLGNVPAAERCICRDGELQDADRGATPERPFSWLRALLGK